MSNKYQLLARLSGFLAVLMATLMFTACDGEFSDQKRLNYDPADDNFEMPTALKQKLDLGQDEQLFSLKEEGAASEIDKLVILDEAGIGAKYYLQDVHFDEFHVVKNAKELAYLAKIHEDDAKRLKINEGSRWFLMKNGSEPLRLSSPKGWVYTDPSEYVGQTELHDGLVFSYGTYFDLDGKSLSFGKNINDVVSADFVSGNYVALKRKLNGKEVTTLVNVKTSERRSYDTYFTPDFVQITNDHKGLMSDIRGDLLSQETLISALEDEFKQDNIDDGKRGPAFKRIDLNNQCLWFNSSVRIPGQEAAFLSCYSNKMDHRIVKAKYKAGKISMKEISKIKSSTAYSHIKKARPFVQGENFTLVKNESSIIYIPHLKSASIITIKPGFSSVLDVRPSIDLKKFFIIGEKVNGDQLMKIFDGATGNEIGSKEIEVK